MPFGPALRYDQTGLDGLSQPHFIRKQRTFRERRRKGEKRRIDLMRIHVHLRARDCHSQSL